MVYYDFSTEALRAENIDAAIKNIILSKYTMKQVVNTTTVGAWDVTYYRETDKALASVSNIPRGAAFPFDTLDFEKNTVRQAKHGLETFFFEEDVLSDNVDVRDRALIRLADAVAFSVDDTIYTALQGNAGVALAIAAGETWDNSTRANRIPAEHFARAAAAINGSNLRTRFRADTTIISVSDEPYILSNDSIMDAFTATGENLMKNGNLGQIWKMNLISTPVVDADEALVLQSKVCGTWAGLQGLKTATKEDPGLRTTVRAWEYGTAYVVSPNAVCRITNTRS